MRRFSAGSEARRAHRDMVARGRRAPRCRLQAGAPRAAARRPGRVARTSLALSVVAVSVLAWVGNGTAASTLQLSLSPSKPRMDTEAMLTVRGTTDSQGVLVVAPLSRGTSCPARTPDNAHPDYDDLKVVQGSFIQRFRVYVEATTRIFCVYLQPANVHNGDLQWTSSTQSLARAGLVLPKQIAGSLQGQPYAGVSGGTRAGDSGVSLDFNSAGTRVVRVRVVCGGSALRPPSLGKEFIGKRFSARVSIPLTPHIRWSGLVRPDNSRNYEPPVPAVWSKPTRFSLDVRMTFDSGTPKGLVGTGRLTSPGLPCPVLRRYVSP